MDWLKILKSKILMIKKTLFMLFGLTSMQEAPGGISSTADGWTADNTKGSFLEMTASWIEVKDGKWKL